MEAQIRDNNFA